MRVFIKKLLIILIVFGISISTANAANDIKFVAKINQDFSTQSLPEEVNFKTIKKMTILDKIEIPQRSIITAQTIQAQKERRWHKSGYILCKLKSYTTETDNKPIDISDNEIYMIVRKYEPVNKKEVAIVGTEILLAQAASFFAPGVDILYFFTKGAIQRKKNPHWFKAGVSNAYDNSICWFWLKGKPIEIEEGQLISIKDIKEKKVYKLKEQIEKRNEKIAIRNKNKELRAEKRAAKKALKALNAKDKEYIPYTILTDEIIDQTISTELFFPENPNIQYDI
ncbi:MAG: hypothetical protein VZR09_02595 [Candidatus Gastranaerophilaceae bacterium]|nr:hypothetical protein [Candidatus Gastranaerophilaceae bacterium]